MSVDLQRCARCGLPSTYDTIVFLPDGTCTICRAHDNRAKVDWVAKRKQLGEIIEKHRGKHGYDVIVPGSGGKDSIYALWYLVTEFKIKPLVVCYDHSFRRAGVNKNMERAVKRLGVDVHTFSANWKLIKKVMLEGLIRRGDACLHCHLNTFAYPIHVAVEKNVPLVMWGEESKQHTANYSEDEVEIVNEERFSRIVNLGLSADDLASFIKKDADWDYRDLNTFRFPAKKDLDRIGLESVCLGSYIPWDTRANVEIIQRELGWECDELEGVPPGHWDYSKLECTQQGVREYIKFLKRSFTSITQNCAFDLRNGRMTQQEAEMLRAQEGKRPASLPIFLEYVGISESEFYEYVKASVVYPNVMDTTRGDSKPVHDMDQWYRESK